MDIGTKIVFTVKEGPCHIMIDKNPPSLKLWYLVESNVLTMVSELINGNLWR